MAGVRGHTQCDKNSAGQYRAQWEHVGGAPKPSEGGGRRPGG